MRYIDPDDFTPRVARITCEACNGSGTTVTWILHENTDEDTLRAVPGDDAGNDFVNDPEALCCTEGLEICVDCLGTGVMRCVVCGERDAVIARLGEELEEAWCEDCAPEREVAGDPLLRIRALGAPQPAGRFRPEYPRREGARRGRSRRRRWGSA